MRRKNWTVIFFVGLLMLGAASGVWAQSVADVTEQLILDIEKLAELKQILAQLYQEYTMLQQGYEKIKGLSQGTFSLHKAFLDGLLVVSPAVSSYPKVVDIMSKESSLLQGCQSGTSYFQGTGLFTPAESAGFSANYGLLLQRGQRDIDELTMVTTDGELRMSDAERLAAIDRIDNDIGRQLTAMRAFNNSIAVVAAQRAQEGRDAGVLRGLYGVQP